MKPPHILKKKDVKCIDLDLDNRHSVPPLVVNELKKYANEKSYLPVEGLHELRQAISDHYVNEQSLDVSLKNILVGPGSKELMYILQMVLDCTVIIPSPSWVSYEPQSII